MSGEHLLIIIVVGIVAGWLAGLLVAGGGFGLIGDLIIGIIGAFIGNYLFTYFHWHLGTGLVGSIIHATIGAIILLFLLRLVGGFGAGRGYGRRW